MVKEKKSLMANSIKEMNSPIFLDSLPKSGTHLLAKALSGAPDIAHSGKHLDRKTIAQFVDAEASYPIEDREDISAQKDYQWIYRLLASIPPGQFVTAHFKYHPKIRDALKELNFKLLVMVRDPRDVVLSWADYMAKERSHLLYPFFCGKSMDYRIRCGIIGVSSEITGTRRQPPVDELLDGHLKWISEAGAFLVRFEQLIGEKGGGSLDMQIQALKNLMDWLESGCDWKTIESIGRNLFGGTYTFNAGMVGRWREHFTEEHRRLFKQRAGDLLIQMGYEKDDKW